MPEQLTLYSNSVSREFVKETCPYAQRVEIALKELGADFTRCEIDLRNKPEWYVPKVNQVGKVPAIAYGGPIFPPDQPSPESTKLIESLVLLEFVADLFPTRSTLLPPDPVLRAKARYFIDAVSTKLLPTWNSNVYAGKAGADEQRSFLGALEAIQNLLPNDKIYAVSDEFTIGDAAIAPFLQRIHTALKYDKGAYKVGEGLKLYEAVFGAPRFARLQKYIGDLQARKSVQDTYFEASTVDSLLTHTCPWI